MHYLVPENPAREDLRTDQWGIASGSTIMLKSCLALKDV